MLEGNFEIANRNLQNQMNGYVNNGWLLLKKLSDQTSEIWKIDFLLKFNSNEQNIQFKIDDFHSFPEFYHNIRKAANYWYTWTTKHELSNLNHS